MAPIATLHDLFVHHLNDIYGAEKQLLQALPKMAEHSTSAELQSAFADHLAVTKTHVARLEDAFKLLGLTPKAIKCKAMEGLIEEGAELFEEDIDPQVLDAGLIAAAQRIEHYEISAYGTAAEYARAMQLSEVADLLEKTMSEEKDADKALSSLATGGINQLAELGVGN